MRYTITIDTDNAAFSDWPGYEITRILRQLADCWETVGEPAIGSLHDLNGNVVGSAIYGPIPVDGPRF